MSDIKKWKYEDAPDHWQALSRTDIDAKSIIIAPKGINQKVLDKHLGKDPYEHYDFIEKDVYITY